MDKFSFSDEAAGSFRCAKIFKDCLQRINSLDFSPDGRYLVVGCNDNSVHLYDIEQGKKLDEFSNNRYGVRYVKFCSDSRNIICASVKEDARIMYWSLSENKIIMTFLGHTDEITGLQMNLMDDTFLSESMDGTIRIWSLREQKLQYVFNSCVAGCFDNSGYVLAIAHHEQDNYYINLHPAHLYTEHPFAIIGLKKEIEEINKIRFSAKGNWLLVCLSYSLVILDSLTGEEKHRISPMSAPNTPARVLCSAFSPDSGYVGTGDAEGCIRIYSVDSGEQVFESTQHMEGVEAMLFHHIYAMMISVGLNICIWIPFSTRINI